MKIFDFNTIKSLNISPKQCVAWVKEAFLLKYESLLPPKLSLHLDHNIFINTMPCLIPSINRFGVKIVSRYPQKVPTLNSDLLLYNSSNGELIALMDSNWITAYRTGAVASVAINTLKKSDASIYAFLGLGNMARATLLCLLESNSDQMFNIKLLAHKGQERLFINRFSSYSNVNFTVVPSIEGLIKDSHIIVSCITAADSNIAPDQYFDEGVLVVPVHTRGFQNCDLFFDKVIVDDFEHVKDFKYYDKFRYKAELGDIFRKKQIGRISDQERILSYNIGISVHDIFFAHKIYEFASDQILNNKNLFSEHEKFWV